MENINSLRNEKTGRFQTTTNSTRYKMVQFNNKRMAEHARVICIALNIPEIPKGFIVHHLDEDKRNNDINNLSLITITAHNRIHSHEAWNKGIKKGDNEKWDNALYEQRKGREKTFNKKLKETHQLKVSGKNNTEISKILNISRAGVIYRLKKYEKHN